MRGGQGQNRTADTRIFSPLLYRLSYLAIFDALMTTLDCREREIIANQTALSIIFRGLFDGRLLYAVQRSLLIAIICGRIF